MNWAATFINQHPVMSFWLFATAVGALPTPTDKNGQFYQWFFNFFSVVAAGLSRVIATNLPNSGVGKLLAGNKSNA